MFDVTQFDLQQDQLARTILDRMYPNQTFSNPEREEKALQDVKWMLLFLKEGYSVQNTTIVANLIIWFRKLFVGLDIEPSHADLLFEVTKQVIRDVFNSSDLNAFLASIKVETLMDYDILMHENPYEEDKNRYLDALLTSNRSEAQAVVRALLDRGVPVPDIYLYIFQETMRQVGVLWQDGIIQVGREHYCTAVTQYLMTTMYAHIFTSEKRENKMLACAVGSELHEMGIRMVADLFEMNGWDTTYLGANLPIDQVVQFAKDIHPQIIALSITMPYHIGTLRKTIEAIRVEQDLQDVKIMVGGLPFLNNESLYKTIGADAYAPSAVEAITVAQTLL